MRDVVEETSPERKTEKLSQVAARPLAVVAPVNRGWFGIGGSLVWVEPETEDEVARVLKLCNDEGWTVVPTGAGTQSFTGVTGRLPDVVLSLRRMNRVLEYSPSDMVVMVQSGTPLSVLQRTLADQNQMLPIDAVVPDDATVGGIIATAASGPRRALYGSVRDMLIGLRTVYPNGNVIRVGGKVVKNVAGYDMTKLFIGSYGTLAAVTEATFKLRPRPMHRETVLLTGNRSNMDELRRRIVGSYLIPSRLEALYGDYSPEVRGVSTDAWTMAVDCDENEPSAAYQTDELRQLALELGLGCEVFRGEEADEWWALYRRPLLRAKVVVRVTAPPSKITSIAESVMSSLPEECAFRLSLGLVTGVGHIYIEDAQSKRWPEWIRGARQTFTQAGGNLVVEQAPPAIRDEVDSFGSLGPLETLQRGIKASIDTKGIMNPGRFVGGM